MEKIRTYLIDKKKPKAQYGIPTHWLREYLPEGGELELFQEGNKLVLTPKKRIPEKAADR